MKFRSLTSSACCLLILACGGADQDANAGEPVEQVAVVDDETALDELTNYYETHFNMGHASMVTDKLYAEDAIVLAANGTVQDGREAITASMEASMAAISPQVTITQADRLIVGNHALSRGTYAVAGEADGQAVAYGGAFLNLLEKTGEEWKVKALQTNYDSEPTAEMWVGMPEDNEPPAEESMLTALIEGYETHYNLGHASMVADFFTEGGSASFGGGAWLSGREAITASIAENMAEGSPQLDVHGVETTLLGDGMAADSGWYEIFVDGNRVSWGTYSLLAKQDAEGEYKIDWFVANASPAAS